LIFKGFVDKEELKKITGENYDEKKFNKVDSDEDGRISFQGKTLLNIISVQVLKIKLNEKKKDNLIYENIYKNFSIIEIIHDHFFSI
jgi:hypothetical protein